MFYNYFAVLISDLMEPPPPWEQDIPFKTALAIAAVHKRKFEAEIRSWQQKCVAFEQKLEQLEAENARAIASGSPEVLLEAIFATSTHPRPTENLAYDLPEQLDSLAISASLWSKAAETLHLDSHPFLCQVLDYAARRRATQAASEVDNTSAAGGGSTAGAAAALISTPTPAQSLIKLMKDITFTASSSQSHQATILPQAAACLTQLCLRPLDCLSEQDFTSLQEFISELLTATYTADSSQDLPRKESEEECGGNLGSMEETHSQWKTTAAAATRIEQSRAGDCSSSSFSGNHAAIRLLETLQNSSGTGYLVLGCAGHGLQDLLRRLRASVIGEQERDLAPLLPGSKDLDQDQEESLLVRACMQVATVLHSCLRELPAWSGEMSPDDGFLRGVAAAIWDASAMCDVVAPAYPEVAKQGQRCAALLVSALQQMSSAQPSANTQVHMP